MEHALYWQEEFPGDYQRYMRARKFNRRVRFFNKANRGKCANKHGVFIETILEGDEVCGDTDDVCPVEARKYLFEEEWFDVRSDREEEEKEEDLTNSANVTSCVWSVTASVSVEETDNPELDGDNHVTDKTQEEVVGTFGVTSALPQNDPPTLGSGFYLDSMGRTRRFSHRLQAKDKLVGK
jgi:hypothetical protein